MILPGLPRAVLWGSVADWLAERLPPALAMLAIVVLVLRLIAGVW